MAIPKGAGALRDRVTIFCPSYTADSMGGYGDKTESVLGTFFAQVNCTQARDNVIADQTRDLRTHEVILRKGTVIVKQGDTVVWNGDRLTVKATRIVANWLILDCVTEAQ